MEGWLGGWVRTEKVYLSADSRPYPSSNRAQSRATTLIETKVLQLHNV